MTSPTSTAQCNSNYRCSNAQYYSFSMAKNCKTENIKPTNGGKQTRAHKTYKQGDQMTEIFKSLNFPCMSYKQPEIFDNFIYY